VFGRAHRDTIDAIPPFRVKSFFVMAAHIERDQNSIGDALHQYDNGNIHFEVAYEAYRHG
jgi:hypothetical protein